MTRDHRLREWNYVVGIVVTVAKTMSAEIYDLMSRRAQLADQFLLQTKSTVIGGNPYAHIISLPSSVLIHHEALTRQSCNQTTKPCFTRETLSSQREKYFLDQERLHHALSVSAVRLLLGSAPP